MEENKVTYFASVKGGIVPTKDKENAGRDCYARIEEKDGVVEMLLPKLQVSKIPLGFASYLDQRDMLSINWERSSVGGLGVLVLSGLVDSTYQGEVILQVVPLVHNILITNQTDKIEFEEAIDTVLYPVSKAIAQAVVIEQSQAKDVEITYDELLSKPSQRGTGGWGSTNK